MGHVLGGTLAAIYAAVTAGIIGALAPLGSQARLGELVLAVPVASLDTIEKLNPEVDAIVCLKIPEDEARPVALAFSPGPSAPGVQLGNLKQAKANRHEADRYAKAMRPVLVEPRNLPVEKIADELTKRKVATPRGGRWHGRTVARLLDHLRLR